MTNCPRPENMKRSASSFESFRAAAFIAADLPHALARMKAHGEHAVTLARDMVSELEESGNIDGASMWRRIIAAIEKLRGAKAK
ncbi:MAG TPA: hypothetical protein VMA53_00940 [Stellaceae bacterium]|nr:hypothetical protein [Stellaceae bacterium]